MSEVVETVAISNYATAYFDGNWDEFRACVSEFVLNDLKVAEICQSVAEGIEEYEMREDRRIDWALPVLYAPDKYELTTKDFYGEFSGGQKFRKFGNMLLTGVSGLGKAWLRFPFTF